MTTLYLPGEPIHSVFSRRHRPHTHLRRPHSVSHPLLRSMDPATSFLRHRQPETLILYKWSLVPNMTRLPRTGHQESKPSTCAESPETRVIDPFDTCVQSIAQRNEQVNRPACGIQLLRRSQHDRPQHAGSSSSATQSSSCSLILLTFYFSSLTSDSTLIASIPQSASSRTPACNPDSTVPTSPTPCLASPRFNADHILPQLVSEGREPV